MFIRMFAAALVLGAGAAGADQIELSKEMQAASLHEGGVDMVVYYLEEPDHFQVVATYAPKREAYEPARMRMGLMDGDSVRFGVPGEPQVIYSFARSGNTVTVRADPTEQSFTEARLD